MFGAKQNGISMYNTVDSSVSGAQFEQKWFESVIMVLTRIKENYYIPVEAHRRLIEVCEGLQWVQENLNEKLNSQHRTLLKSLYSVNIQIINGAIETKNMEYLDIVISTLKTITQPYYRNGDKPAE
jgi:hypothetical protein